MQTPQPQTLSPYVPTADPAKAGYLRLACLLRAIAIRVRQEGRRKRRQHLAMQIDALAKSVDLAERGVPNADRRVVARAEELLRA
jgi:hypothetical protein